jgi:hypothetical protein
MKSVPARSSGWVSSLPIADLRLQLAFGNAKTHPLPRGGTNLMGPLPDLGDRIVLSNCSNTGETCRLIPQQSTVAFCETFAR